MELNKGQMRPRSFLARSNVWDYVLPTCGSVVDCVWLGGLWVWWDCLPAAPSWTVFDWVDYVLPTCGSVVDCVWLGGLCFAYLRLRCGLCLTGWTMFCLPVAPSWTVFDWVDFAYLRLRRGLCLTGWTMFCLPAAPSWTVFDWVDYVLPTCGSVVDCVWLGGLCFAYLRLRRGLCLTGWTMFCLPAAPSWTVFDWVDYGFDGTAYLRLRRGLCLTGWTLPTCGSVVDCVWLGGLCFAYLRLRRGLCLTGWTMFCLPAAPSWTLFDWVDYVLPTCGSVVDCVWLGGLWVWWDCLPAAPSWTVFDWVDFAYLRLRRGLCLTGWTMFCLPAAPSWTVFDWVDYVLPTCGSVVDCVWLGGLCLPAAPSWTVFDWVDYGFDGTAPCGTSRRLVNVQRPLVLLRLGLHGQRGRLSSCPTSGAPSTSPTPHWGLLPPASPCIICLC